MSEKRYSIVRVDNLCPQDLEDNINRCIGEHCKKCNYGDTKEQLIMKIEQELNRYVYKIKLSEVARKIVEFFGVEE